MVKDALTTNHHSRSRAIPHQRGPAWTRRVCRPPPRRSADFEAKLPHRRRRPQTHQPLPSFSTTLKREKRALLNENASQQLRTNNVENGCGFQMNVWNM